MPIIVIYIIGIFIYIAHIKEVESMKINDIQRTGAINPYRKMNDAQLTQAEAKKAKKKDEVNISSEAIELQSSIGSNKQIEELKQSYNLGSYHVDAREIADKIFPYIK
jgi:negative regulator of flagellin synthesis FlgM